MKLDIQFKELEILVSNMGASQVEWKSDVAIEALETDWKIKLETTGIEVSIDDIDFTPNGAKFRGEQILLHIKEVNGFGYYTLPKFHFYQCSKLSSMDKAGRLNRYVVTQRKSGYFLLDKKIGYNHYERNQEVQLSVCWFCLNWYNKNYRKNYTVDNFDIHAFFEQFNDSPITRKPTYTDTTAPASGYADDWNGISLRMREQTNWRCQQCGKDCSQTKTGLQVHHIDGVKAHTHESNLKVLCEYCHAQQPNHQHMKARLR
jgi:hypothetical protein